MDKKILAVALICLILVGATFSIIYIYESDVNLRKEREIALRIDLDKTESRVKALGADSAYWKSEAQYWKDRKVVKFNATASQTEVERFWQESAEFWKKETKRQENQTEYWRDSYQSRPTVEKIVYRNATDAREEALKILKGLNITQMNFTQFTIGFGEMTFKNVTYAGKDGTMLLIGEAIVKRASKDYAEITLRDIMFQVPYIYGSYGGRMMQIYLKGEVKIVIK